MKHCILVKFKKDYPWQEELTNIQSIFNGIGVEGVHFTEYLTNCTDRENRYDLCIRIDMERGALEAYDNCRSHHVWKDTYSP